MTVWPGGTRTSSVVLSIVIWYSRPRGLSHRSTRPPYAVAAASM
jgi:hypothetical protein